MKHKNWKLMISMLVIISLSFSLAGCGGTDAPDSDDTGDMPDETIGGAIAPEDFKVALLTSSAINDNGWGAAGYSGLMAVEENLGVEVNFSESVAKSDMEEVLRAYATQGYQLIFAHGSEFIDSAKIVAPAFPEVHFVITNGYFYEDNISSFSVNSAEMGFLEGAAAAVISKTKKVAAIGGEEITPIKLGIEGFVQGAKYTDPSVEVATAYTGSMKDVPQLKELAINMIDNGADVICSHANAAGLGGIEAAQEKGVYAIGSSSDQHSFGPDTVVTSGTQDIGSAMTFVAQTIMNDEYESGIYMVGVKDGAVKLAPFYEFEEILTPEQLQRIEEVVNDVKTGKVTIDLDTTTGKVDFQVN